MGFQGIYKINYKYNNNFKKYNVILVVKEYFEFLKTHFSWMKMGVQGNNKFNNISEMLKMILVVKRKF